MSLKIWAKSRKVIKLTPQFIFKNSEIFGKHSLGIDTAFATMSEPPLHGIRIWECNLYKYRCDWFDMDIYGHTHSPNAWTAVPSVFARGDLSREGNIQGVPNQYAVKPIFFRDVLNNFEDYPAGYCKSWKLCILVATKPLKILSRLGW